MGFEKVQQSQHEGEEIIRERNSLQENKSDRSKLSR